MSRELIALAAAAALLVSASAANAKDPVKLTSGQLDKVTAGAANVQNPINAVMLANGASGINQFSPSTATVTQSNVATGLNLFTIQ